MTAVGVDWASGYWITAAITDDEDEVSLNAYPSIYNVWHDHQTADEILVDIPIGLPGESSEEFLDEGRRLCDVAARDALPSQIRSSVFPTPCRKAVEASDYETARDHNEAILGRGLGSQSWSLVPRIREVDVFLRNTSDAREIVRESHPEVCFAALADGLEERKATGAGLRTRREILADLDDDRLATAFDDKKAEVDPDEGDDREYAAWKHRITKTRLDDVLDALVLAHTASLDETESLPTATDHLQNRDDPPTDGCELPMEIVRPTPDARQSS